MGYDMQEGTVVRWLKSEGSKIIIGEAIAEIETDKAVVELEATESGTLTKILATDGATVPVGQSIAIIGSEDEKLAQTLPETPQNQSATNPSAPPLSPLVTQTEESKTPIDEIRISPVARKLAKDNDVDLELVVGTGPGGRITRNDILSFQSGNALATDLPGSSNKKTAPTSKNPSRETIPLSRMRQQIARVTVKSKQEIPHFYVSAEIDMTQVMRKRTQLNDELKEQGIRVSVNDLIIQSCVGALKMYPKLNATFQEDCIYMNTSINVGIAIAEDEGLIIPAIMNCANKSLTEISTASKNLIERCKSGTLRPQEYTGGTFTISNLGMFDISRFVAIIQPPQAAVLAVGTVTKTPVVRDDDIAIAEMMTGTLSVDHRIADGAEGAQFITEVKRLLENPDSLID